MLPYMYICLCNNVICYTYTHTYTHFEPNSYLTVYTHKSNSV